MLRAWAANAIIETAALLSKYFIHSPSKMLMDLWHVLGLFCRYESQTQPLARQNYWRALAATFSVLSHLPQLLVCCLSFQRGEKMGGGDRKAALRPQWSLD